MAELLYDAGLWMVECLRLRGKGHRLRLQTNHGADRLALAAGGTHGRRNAPVVAVARKLAVLLLTLWKNKSAYQAFPGHNGQKLRTSDLERLRCIA
jgi:hypothetical protein